MINKILFGLVLGLAWLYQFIFWVDQEALLSSCLGIFLSTYFTIYGGLHLFRRIWRKP